MMAKPLSYQFTHQGGGRLGGGFVSGGRGGGVAAGPWDGENLREFRCLHLDGAGQVPDL